MLCIYKLIKVLKSTLLSHKLDKVKIIVADSDWHVSEDILKYPSFADVVDIIGLFDFINILLMNTTPNCSKSNFKSPLSWDNLY